MHDCVWRSTISALDREKDGLQMEVDQKAERLVQNSEEIALKVSEVMLPQIFSQVVNINDSFLVSNTSGCFGDFQF